MAPQQPSVRVTGPPSAQSDQVLTPEALDFIARLARRFTPRLEELLARRRAVQARYDAGKRPDFLPQTAHIRESDWKV